MSGDRVLAVVCRPPLVFCSAHIIPLTVTRAILAQVYMSAEAAHLSVSDDCLQTFTNSVTRESGAIKQSMARPYLKNVERD